ncbi:hypothetical protein Y032_0241g3391 [Ancylostoma ceylanicum]|uniref:Uncharacterized protein n=1 Tax=Ancylostoma ceylanicum TaxID=53326 RepID=A0A016SEU7_9BILA|nr:hypothetical protein Y032_0241g3391 [Ancylostoma ceylanicum]
MDWKGTLSELLKTPTEREPKETAKARDEFDLLDDPEVAQMLNVPLIEDTVPEQVPEPPPALKEDTRRGSSV